MGLDLLPLIEGRRKVLFLDAVDFGKEPGFCATIEGDRVRQLSGLSSSIHQAGIISALAAVWWSMSPAPEFCLAGIQPASLDLGLELTSQVEARMEMFIEMILEVLRGWGISWTGK